MNQLTIFDVIERFDENLANWTDVLGSFERCTVLAYIPKEAKSAMKNGFPDTPEKKRIDDIWGNYACAIMSYIGFVDKRWEKACNKLQEYRDAGKPCPMEIHRRKDGTMDFVPERVVEYL